MSVIERRPHQVRALGKLAGHYSGGGTRAQIHWTCATGKTFVGRWLAEDLAADTTVVFVPSLALIAQTLAEWQTVGGWRFAPAVVCSDPTAGDAWRVDNGWWSEHGVQVTTDAAPIARFLATPNVIPRVVFSTYHSAPVVADALRRARHRADLMVCDEAHHLAGDSRFQIVLDDARVPAVRRLFTTATPVLTRGRTSMANEHLYGPVLDRVDFEEARERDLVVDYEVLVVDANGAQDLPAGSVVPAALAAAARRGASRVLSFHSRVATARRFAESVDGITLPDDREVRAAAIAGTDPSSRRREVLHQLGDLTHPGLTLVTNARCCAEGVNVPGVDAVLFADPKDGETEIIQAIGRAVRKAPGKTRGLIVLPVVLDQGDTADLYSGRFAAIWGVLRALRNLDPRMAAELDHARPLRGDDQKPPSGGRGGPRNRQLITFEVDGLDLSVFAPLIVDDRDTDHTQWSTYVDLVREWVKQHGHSALPTSVRVGDLWAGRWVAAQRKAYAAGALTPWQAASLRSIPGWSWTFDGAWWNADVSFVATIARNGLDLEDEAVANAQLTHRPGKTRTTVARWSAQQRRDYRDLLLEDWQITMCEAIPGWSWNAGVPERDLRMVDALAEYVDAHGDANVPHDTMWGNLPLGSFVTALRRRSVTGRLSLALAADIAIVTPRPHAVGGGALDWRPNDTRWELMLLAVHQFQQRTGGLDVPEHHIETFRGWPAPIYVWCTRQRHLYRHNSDQLTEERRRLLELVPGWTWERPRKERVKVDIGVRAHGTRAGYAAGCTCDDCTKANRTYNDNLVVDGQSTTSLMDASTARGHCRVLEAQVPWRGRTAMQEITALNKKTIDEVINGDRKRVQPWVHDALMALTADRLREHIDGNPSPRDPMPAEPTFELIADMTRRGWPQAWISGEIGRNGKALQIGKTGGSIRRETADAISALHARLGNRVAPPREWHSCLPTLDDILAAELRPSAPSGGAR